MNNNHETQPDKEPFGTPLEITMFQLAETAFK
jgi:hypothetical protein